MTTTQTRRPVAAPSHTAGVPPGLGLAAGGALIAYVVSRLVPVASPLLIAIVLGAAVAGAGGVTPRLAPGLAFSSKRLLRAGIVLLGLHLSVQDVFGLGPGMLVVTVAVVALGIGSALWFGARLGLTWNQRLLIACGFSICGAAAVAATDGVIDADEEEVVTSVALVVVFGTAMIPEIPYLAMLFGLNDRQAGLWAGTSIHEVAQVVAAGGAIGGGALTVAVVAKLARVLMLAPVMAAVGWHERQAGRTPGDGTRTPPLMPLFVVGFIAMVALRSVVVPPPVVVDGLNVVQTTLLAAAMFALGTGVSWGGLRRVGWRPLALGAVTTGVVASVGLGGVLLVG
ncbi:YeiH family protein [Luteipulveratus mongoliensis]|uniref:Membrane protein n=1 Tax=Luteipulveratus mongoliensis TaxID=571913 RepID=A0A0K1JQ93_9MICO|nr:putative sulfate exporter family transporter [Luteipulveratus mongoliensis]AKU18894.1 membrane protein [Luteipulveratus mongoliensis]